MFHFWFHGYNDLVWDGTNLLKIYLTLNLGLSFSLILMSLSFLPFPNASEFFIFEDIYLYIFQTLPINEWSMDF